MAFFTVKERSLIFIHFDDDFQFLLAIDRRSYPIDTFFCVKPLHV
jgi:hypothetical protein